MADFETKEKPKPVIEFNGYTCNVVKRQYSGNDRTALILTDATDGEYLTTASVNVPDIDLKDDEIVIKNYSENEGILEILTKAGLVKPLYEVTSGFVKHNVCKLLF